MSARARLVWRRPDGVEIGYPLADRALVVGREEDADLRVDEPLVSRSHARLEPRGEGWVLTDLGSTNFTRVNGEVISERELEDGDEIRFARAQCRFELERGVETPAAPEPGPTEPPSTTG